MDGSPILEHRQGTRARQCPDCFASVHRNAYWKSRKWILWQLLPLQFSEKGNSSELFQDYVLELTTQHLPDKLMCCSGVESYAADDLIGVGQDSAKSV